MQISLLLGVSSWKARKHAKLGPNLKQTEVKIDQLF